MLNKKNKPIKMIKKYQEHNSSLQRWNGSFGGGEMANGHTQGRERERERERENKEEEEGPHVLTLGVIITNG